MHVPQTGRAGLSRISAWATKPGRFYFAVCLFLCGAQALNLYLYLRTPHLVSYVLPKPAQLFSLTIGTLFLFRALQVSGSFVWMLIDPAEPETAILSANDAHLPYVTVQIPLRNEDIHVAKLSIDSAFSLTYPRDRLQVLVMDNSDPGHSFDEIRQYVEARGGVFGHRAGVEGFKARNLNLLLPDTRGEFLLILDADSTVPSDILLRTLPLFEDPLLGYVQFRIDTLNEETNLITRVGAMAARTKTRLSRLRNHQGFVIFEGHNGMIRRRALEVVGGWSEEVSEDLATAIEMRLAGFQSRFVNETSTGEIAPERFQEMMKQRRKWSYGTGRLLWKKIAPILRSDLRWYEKLDLISFMASLAIDGLGFLILFAYIPIPCGTVLIMLILFFLPILLAENFALRRALSRYIPFVAIMAALMPTLAYGTFLSMIGRNEPFPVTLKAGGKSLEFGELVRVHIFGITSACLFFVGACFVVRDIAHFFHYYSGATMVMAAALVVPFLIEDIATGRSIYGEKRSRPNPAPETVDRCPEI